ncbi:MAG: hypothetical protein U0944_00425 [Candidatus Moranbacteria bacterium]|nr:hypothetical protein [Candidatus Moranbacteria bacterium]MDZ4384866.1 hypothetical protein [Candidatus Moranbacteria bacterium]
MKKNLLFALVAVSLMMSSAAYAEEEIETQKTNGQIRQENREEIRAGKKTAIEDQKGEQQQKREETREQRCARIQERIANGSTDADNRKEKHMSVYGNMVDRISKFITRLADDDYDVSKIQADLAVLEEKIQKFSDDYATQVAKIGDTKNLACGQSDGDFKNGLVEARAMMKNVRADAADIREYMLKTVRPDIQALRGQKVKAKNAATE